ncbi:Putative phospholipase A2 [Fulvia fulva]|uniref:Putative phospholipase n=1 Tax=Passalora fulva TaxID=5499 RepID=A0A9Q8PHU6_PASFU|nr:Putative phospholipase A2 [Fulvia fulva]KAK4626843.1 putative phospholipase A2 [Fulvia fulva]KAK4628303.1 putative phospholipase A2 [Fulvia fulva]UJO22696.1 Putative phospholipase A2 [Fulvia fulva]WPV14317.1 Putative phospholipase A2 [Fulvia fulva]WPV29143.1 Putative phospholipase A2 [Fulvia fulva]
MSSLLSGWNPIVSFPQYNGPYDVGTVDVEIPAADLHAPSEAPEGAAPTIAFRIFYPCVKPGPGATGRPVRWIPQPQRATIRAFANFIGVKSPRIANLISWMPQQLYYINLPAHRNAKLLDPPTSHGRWPVTMFSHGLAGSRNAYSYVCGDLASNGMIVIALDHRDGSSPIQYVRETASTEAHIVNPTKISHEPSPEVYEARDKQLRIRLWEISMAYEALVKIDAGQRLENLDINSSTKRKERVEVLWQFDGMLDIHREGKVTWAGHSFGAATQVQLVKSIYYHPTHAGNALIKPNADAAVASQITPDSPMLLLDMWGLPLKSPDQAYLWDKPLPSYAIGGPNGSNVVSILSEAFFNWQDNTNINKHIVAPPSLSRRPSTAPRLSRAPGKILPDWARLRDESPSRDSGYVSQRSRSPLPPLSRKRSKASGLTTPSNVASSHKDRATSTKLSLQDSNTQQRRDGTQMWYVQKSQHFNQSDFGLLFPWIAKRIAKAEEPERVMALNNRAMVQVLRDSGIEVAGESDDEILDKEAEIRRWIRVPVDDEEPSNAQAAATLTRKLSVISATGRNITSPRDGMTMGQMTEAKLAQKSPSIKGMEKDLQLEPL